MSDMFTLKYVIMTPELGKSLKSFRITNNKTAKDIVNHFGKAASYISKLEKGDIRKIEGSFLIELCNYIAGSEKGFGQFIEIIGKYSSEQSIETKNSILNIEDLLYEFPLVPQFTTDINDYMKSHNISVHELTDNMNANKDIKDSAEYDNLIPNQWIALDDNRSAIKFQISESYLEDLCSSEPTFQTIHRAIAEGILYSLYQLGNEEDPQIKAYNQLDSYGMHKKTKTITLEKNDLNTLTEIIEKQMNIDFSKFVFQLQLSTLAIKDYGGKRLKQICSNMDNDPDFAFAYMSQDLEPLKSKNKATKQEFLYELKALINKYSQEKDTFEQYD